MVIEKLIKIQKLNIDQINHKSEVTVRCQTHIYILLSFPTPDKVDLLLEVFKKHIKNAKT